MASHGSKTLYQPFFIWVVVLLLTTYVNSMPLDENKTSGWHRTVDKRQSGPMYQGCGSRLDDLLLLICEGNFNSKFNDKRSAEYSGHHLGIFRYHPAADVVRNKRHIVAECCWNSCSRETLEMYCA